MENKQIIYKGPYTQEEFEKILKETFEDVFKEYKDPTENMNIEEKKIFNEMMKKKIENIIYGK